VSAQTFSEQIDTSDTPLQASNRSTSNSCADCMRRSISFPSSQKRIRWHKMTSQASNLVSVILILYQRSCTYRRQILADLSHHNICVFRPPLYENEDAQSILEMKALSDAIPFAIVGSSHVLQTPNGKLVRGRAYPWGVVEVDNEDHCDFIKLRRMLIDTYMEELRERTNIVLYEKWRAGKLLSMGTHHNSSTSEYTKYV
jgi:hypothetical protein